MKTVAIIQARVGSSRLPRKVLADLGGRPLLAWVVDAARAIRDADLVVVATTDRRGDDAVDAWCREHGVAVFRGPEDDVLDRYRGAAAAHEAELVFRITADCPFLSPRAAEQLFWLRRETGADYASNVDPRSWPHGLDCEIFTRAALEDAAAHATEQPHREHVTPFIRESRGRFTVVNLTCPIPGLHRHRVTVDYPEDLERVRRLAGAMQHEPPDLTDLLRAIDRIDRVETDARGSAVPRRG